MLGEGVGGGGVEGAFHRGLDSRNEKCSDAVFFSAGPCGSRKSLLSPEEHKRARRSRDLSKSPSEVKRGC